MDDDRFSDPVFISKIVRTMFWPWWWPLDLALRFNLALLNLAGTLLEWPAYWCNERRDATLKGMESVE